MSFINFRSHLNCAVNEDESHQSRVWALRACCYSVCSLIGVIDTNELIRLIAEKIDAEIDVHRNKVFITSKICDAAQLLVEFRTQMHEQKKQYDDLRRRLKRTKKRFPVQEPYERESVLEVFNNLNCK